MSEKKMELPQQVVGSPAAGECRDTVPVQASSSSYYGPTDACPAGATVEHATAKKTVRKKGSSSILPDEQEEHRVHGLTDEEEAPLEPEDAMEEAKRILDDASKMLVEVTRRYNANPGRPLLQEELVDVARVLSFLAGRWGDINGKGIAASAEGLLRRKNAWDESSLHGSSEEDVLEAASRSFGYADSQLRGGQTHALYVSSIMQLFAVADLCEDPDRIADSLTWAQKCLKVEGVCWTRGRLLRLEKPDSLVTLSLKDDEVLPQGLRGGGPVRPTRQERRVTMMRRIFLHSSDEEVEDPTQVDDPPVALSGEDTELDETPALTATSAAAAASAAAAIVIAESDEEEVAAAPTRTSETLSQPEDTVRASGSSRARKSKDHSAKSLSAIQVRRARFHFLRRGQGRPRKDGSGPFKSGLADDVVMASDEPIHEVEERREREREEEERGTAREGDDPTSLPGLIADAAGRGCPPAPPGCPIVPPSFTGQQRREAEERIRQIESGTSSEFLLNIDEELLKMEDTRQRAKNLKGEISGKLKMGVYVLREVIRTLANRASENGDPGYWRDKAIGLEGDLFAMKAKVEGLEKRVNRQQAEMARMREREPSPPRDAFPTRELREERTRVESPVDTPMEEEEEPRCRWTAQKAVREREGTPPPTLSTDPIVAANLIGIAEVLKHIEGRLQRLEGRVSSAPPPPSASIPAAPLTSGARRRQRRAKRVSMAAREAARGTGGVLTSEALPIPSQTERGGTGTEDGTGVPLPFPPITRGKDTEDDGGNRPLSWAAATRQGKKRSGAGAPPPASTRLPSQPVGGNKRAKAGPRKANLTKAAKRRLPRSAAVLLTAPVGQLSELMAKARKEIPLKDVGLEDTSLGIKGAANGGFLLEISGAEAVAKADRLAAAMRIALSQEEDRVKVTRPSKKMDIRIIGIEESVTAEEIIQAVAAKGECGESEVRLGQWRPAVRRLRTIWAQCPARAAIRVAEATRIRIGWSWARVELLRGRPQRCFRCLARGHTQQQCPSPVERMGCCYQCGKEGHIGAMCKSKAHCPKCQLAGKEASHRIGSAACPAVPPKRRTAEPAEIGETAAARQEAHSPDVGAASGDSTALRDSPIDGQEAPQPEERPLVSQPVTLGTQEDSGSASSMDIDPHRVEKRRRQEQDTEAGEFTSPTRPAGKQMRVIVSRVDAPSQG